MVAGIQFSGGACRWRQVLGPDHGCAHRGKRDHAAQPARGYGQRCLGVRSSCRSVRLARARTKPLIRSWSILFRFVI